MLRFILVNAAHMMIKYSKRMKKKYLRFVRRSGENNAPIAIARILALTMWNNAIQRRCIL